MKKLIFFSALVFALAGDCKKDDQEDTGGPASRILNCRTMELNDDRSPQDYLISYNSDRNPDRVQVGSQTHTLEYDKQFRLIRINYDTLHSVRLFEYKDSSSLPGGSSYYPHGADAQPSLSETFSYSGDQSLVSWEVSEGSKHYLFSLDYDDRGNLLKITRNDQDVPMFEASDYDTRPNLVSGNRWIRQFLFSAEMSYFGRFLLLSNNNPRQWSWNDPALGRKYTTTTSYQYDQTGFPIHVNYLVQSKDTSYTKSYTVRPACSRPINLIMAAGNLIKDEGGSANKNR